MHNNILNFFQFVENFDFNTIKNKSKNLRIIYRNYKNKVNIKEITKYKNFCKKRRIKLYLSNNINLAIKLNLDGVYLPSFNNTSSAVNIKCHKNFQVLGSAHNIIEIKKKIKQGCKLIFLAPLFKTNKSKKFLDINKFSLLTLNEKTNFIALGGINKKNIYKIKMLNVVGIAGISLFQKKTGL